MPRIHDEARTAPLVGLDNVEAAPQAKRSDAGYDVQRAALEPGNQSAVQLHGGSAPQGVDVHATAQAGVAGSGGALPHLDAIQASFGSHDVSGVQHYGGASAQSAASALGAEAYTTGDKVASNGSMSLHTAAHEAAHVVQQRGGVSLKGGVGQSGDSYEQHADAVADAVVAGKSAQGLLDQMAGGGASSGVQSKAVQREDKAKAPSMACDKEGGTHEAAACPLTTDQRFWLRGEVGDRINAAFTRYLDACGTVKEDLKEALEAERAFLGIILGVPFGLATGGLGKLALAGINRLPNGSPDWLLKGGLFVLGKPDLVKKPMESLGGAITKQVTSKYGGDALGFVDGLKSEAGAWAETARGQIPGYSDGQLIAQYAAWANEHTSLGHYVSEIKGHVKRYKAQVETLDKSPRVYGGNYVERKRLVYVKHKMGYKRLATVLHGYSIFTHRQRQGEVVQEQIKDLKKARDEWRKGPRRGTIPDKDEYIKPPPIVKGDRVTFVQWVDKDMTDMAKDKWKKTVTGKREGLIDVAPEQLQNEGAVADWVKETDAYAAKWGGAFEW